ncbi:MAG: FecR domain-containing protein, partial [Pseudomonadota bacterium]
MHRIASTVVILLLVAAQPSFAQELPRRDACVTGPAGTARVLALDGMVSGITAAGDAFSLSLETILCPGDRLSTGEDGRVELGFAEQDSTVGIGRNSTIRLPMVEEEGRNLDLLQGLLRFISSVRDQFAIQTRHANAGIDGTEAVILADEADTLVLVAEGLVTVTPAAGGAGLAAEPGAPVIADEGVSVADPATAPAKFQTLLVDPAGASDWAIHYPPIFLTAQAGPTVAAAAERLDAGDPDGAEQLLAGPIPPADRGAAAALASVIALYRGRPDDATRLAEAARTAAPELPAAAIAQSYALQGQGKIRAARNAAAQAAALSPQDAFALARLAELEFLLGNERRAERAAEGSLAIAPSALAHAINGFLALSAHRRAEAEIAFLLGAQTDSLSPLPRLGQGLVAIRSGRVVEGRRLLELAASLDPRQAALRTWLGRAYQEEDLPEKAAAQYALAKQRDPDDPTPYLLEAVRLFAENRPVEALTELQGARARGDNRSVLRSEAGLGEDRAVRGAAIGRLLDTLGFQEQAITEAEAAVEQDRTNEAALRLLADLYRGREGVEVSRASTLLAAQVYGAPSKAPLDASLAESDLALFDVSGPARATFSELTPFFEGDGLAARITGFAGTQGTYGDSASFSALAEGYSIQVGQFHTETNGFRVNNAVRHEVVNVLGKGQILPWLDIFAEYRYRFTDGGDRSLEFDLVPGGLTQTFGFEDERNLVRGGFHARIGGSQHIAGIGTYVDQETAEKTEGIPTDVFNQDAVEGQLQHVGRFGPFSTVAGGFFSETDFAFGGVPEQAFETTNFNGYGYVTLSIDDLGPLAGAEITGGFSVDVFDTEFFDDFDDTTVNPKAGVKLFLTDDIILRGAFTQTLKPVQILDQRLEPVTVAGFPQFFDTTNGARTRQYGVGADIRLTPWLSTGAEASWRRTETPTPFTGALPGTEDTTDEREFSAYIDAAFANRFSTSLNLRHLDTESEFIFDLAEFRVTEIEASIGWFHPSGFFASGGIGYVFHDFIGDVGGVEQSDDFPIGRLTFGFRLPNERGIVSLDIENAFDSDFSFEDRPLLSGGASLAE